MIWSTEQSKTVLFLFNEIFNLRFSVLETSIEHRSVSIQTQTDINENSEDNEPNHKPKYGNTISPPPLLIHPVPLKKRHPTSSECCSTPERVQLSPMKSDPTERRSSVVVSNKLATQVRYFKSSSLVEWTVHL